MKQVQTYNKTSLFYLRLATGERFGAVAIGLTPENRIRITASVRSTLDDNIPGKEKAIAGNRLKHACFRSGRVNQTKFLDCSIEEAKKLRFENLVVKLGLYKNNFITNWWWGDPILKERITSNGKKKIEKIKTGSWNSYVIKTGPITDLLRNQITWITSADSLPADEKLGSLLAEQEVILAKRKWLKQEIEARKSELRSVRESAKKSWLARIFS